MICLKYVIKRLKQLEITRTMNKQRVLIFFLLVVTIWKCCDYFLLSKESLAVASGIEEETELSPNERFKISVYYEALCSDSRNFILKKLLPTYEALNKYLILDFIPYGKAEVSSKGICLIYNIHI